MAETALITGASSGIGADFARLHASEGGDLVLVARSADKLEQLQVELENTYGISVLVLVEDLSGTGAPERVFQATQKKGIEIEILINNAGVGGHGRFDQQALSRHMAMLQLNIASLVALTHLYLGPMKERGHGKILNVSSAAAFIPGPLQAVYYASKSFVLSFSQSISEELRGSGVTVTALCPGPVKTGFAAAGDLEGVLAFKLGASPDSVARCGYRAMQRGKLVVVNNTILAFLLNWVTPLIPRRILLTFSRISMEKPAR